MLRGGLVGLGNVAVHGHLPGWRRRADAHIAAVSDAEPARRKTARTLLPEARWHDSAEALLEREQLDFLDICTPPSSHAGLIEAALRAGVHVLCEKPLVPSPGALLPLLDLAAARGLTLHTVHNWHHAPIVRRATELIAGGAVGHVQHIAWQTLRPQPAAGGDERTGNWRLDPAIAGGGVLTDHGWHVFYLLHRWMGGAPVTVAARLETRRHHRWPVEDTAAVSLTWPGATADVLLTWAADQRLNRAEIRGSAGTLALDDDTLVLTREGTTERWPCPPALSDGSHHPDRFDPVADLFLRAVGGADRSGHNLAEACQCVAVEALARESSRQGGVGLPLEPLAATLAARSERPCS
jgi:predicted dehydrogenase